MRPTSSPVGLPRGRRRTFPSSEVPPVAARLPLDAAMSISLAQGETAEVETRATVQQLTPRLTSSKAAAGSPCRLFPSLSTSSSRNTGLLTPTVFKPLMMRPGMLPTYVRLVGKQARGRLKNGVHTTAKGNHSNPGRKCSGALSTATPAPPPRQASLMLHIS